MKRNMVLTLCVLTAALATVLIVLFCMALISITNVKLMVLVCIALGVPAMTLLAISVITHYIRNPEP